MSETKTALVYDAQRVAELLSINYSAEELAAFGLAPAPLEGFVTFFDPGRSILRLREAVKRKGTLFYRQSWYEREAFAQREDEPHYRQLRMEAVQSSFRKTFAEQQAPLPAGEEVPTARTAVMGMVLHFLATDGQLFPECYARCADQVSLGSRVGVGYFDGSGLCVSTLWVGDRFSNVGLASAWKVP
jgi:hypothetical protein